MADHGHNRNAGRSTGRGFDPAYIVVIVLGIAVVIGLVSMLMPSGSKARSSGDASAAAEGRVFEGRKLKYKLKTPAGAPWRLMPDALVRQQAQEADLGIQRLGSDAVIMVLGSEVTRDVPLETVVSTLASARVDGLDFEEAERTVVEKGGDRGILVKGKKSGGGKSFFMALLVVARDDILYLVTGAAPMPATPELTAEISSIVKDIELPPAEDVSTLPEPALAIAAPPPPATDVLDPKLRDAAPEALRTLAGRAAAQGRHQEAATLQFLALNKQPKHGEYNLACYEARSGRLDVAFYWLQRAAEDEGVDAGWAEEDADLEEARKDKRWPAVRSYLRRTQRYWAQHPVESETVLVPKGYSPGKPIPVVVAMHGLGSNAENIADGMQKIVDSQSIALVSVSGTRARGPRSFAWAEDVERDRARIEKALAKARDRITPADGKIILFGFSQGAQMAAEIAARQPDRYAGAIVMSPGGRSDLHLAGLQPATLGQRRFVVVVGGGEHPGNVQLAADDSERLRAAGADVYHHPYPEQREHAFPADFEKAFPAWVHYILDNTPIK